MRDFWGCIWYGFLAIVIVVSVTIGIFGGAFVSNDVAVKTLETNGFSDVKVLAKDIWFVQFKGGSNTDNAMFTCSATNPVGKEVQVNVYAGWPWKAGTIRVK